MKIHPLNPLSLKGGRDLEVAARSLFEEEKLLPPPVLQKVHTLRRALAGTDPMNAMKMLLERLQKFPTNEAFLKSF